MKTLPAEALPINADVIRVLTETLEAAKSGKISDVAVAWIKPNGVSGNNFSHGQNRSAALIGSIQYLQRDMMDCVESVNDV